MSDLYDAEGEDFLKSLDADIEEFESLLKSGDDEVDGVDSEIAEILKSAGHSDEEIQDLLKASKKPSKKDEPEDEEDEPEDEPEEEDEGEPEEDDEPEEKGKKMNKSSDDEDVFLDATPVLQKSMELNKKLKSKVESQGKDIEVLTALVKSLGKISINSQKILTSLAGLPQGNLKGTGAPNKDTLLNLVKSKSEDQTNKYNGFTYKQAMAVMLKSLQAKESLIARSDVMALEQRGVMTPAANDLLILKSKAV